MATPKAPVKIELRDASLEQAWNEIEHAINEWHETVKTRGAVAQREAKTAVTALIREYVGTDAKRRTAIDVLIAKKLDILFD